MLALLITVVASSDLSYGLCIAGCYTVSFVGKLFSKSAVQQRTSFIGPIFGGAAAGLHGRDECVRACKPFIGSSSKSDDL